MRKKVFVRTYGCQMNTRDSEVIAGLLKKEGHELTDDAGKADIVLFNTCAVRQHAEDKVWSEIGRIRKMGTAPIRGQPPFFPIIGVIGCMAQNYKEKVFDRSPNVDFVVGPSDIHKIPDIIAKLSTIGHRLSTGFMFESKIWETESEIRPEEIYHTGFYEDKEHSYVVISEGCSNYCAYCVVPYTRGPLHHRNFKEIIREIELAMDKGITKITLLGQNVNSYQDENINFIKLIESVNSIRGLNEFSFITSHPKDTAIELFNAMADLEKLKKYLHLPVQSGSDRILKLMNRGYDRRNYLELAGNYHKIVKGGALSTDIIVGFPSETEQDFQDTFGLLKEVEFNSAFIFKYSPRLNTEAAKLTDDVPKEEKERRHGLILGLQKEISKKLKVKS